jgi:hypothetical protein
MVEAVVPCAFSIQFTDGEVQPLASEMAAGLKETGMETKTVYTPPEQETYGTPEVILTIAVAAVAKAVVISALHAIERRLKLAKSTGRDQRIQIVIDASGKDKKRFLFSLQDVADEAIDEFVSGVIDFVAVL